MIDLNIQIKLIIFSFIFGFFFSILIEIFNKKTENCKKSVKLILSFLVVFLSTLIYFEGINRIGNAIFHIYSVITIVIGFISYDFLLRLIANKTKKWYTFIGDDMAKRRITVASKRRLTIFGTISIVAVVYFCFSLICSFYSVYNLTKQKEALDNKYSELEQKAEELKLDINKLNDPKYLADYARENYLYSKDDEYIIQIEEIIEEKEQIDTINTKINKNYILVGLSFGILLIFVYIIIKGTKKDKKK